MSIIGKGFAEVLEWLINFAKDKSFIPQYFEIIGNLINCSPHGNRFEVFKYGIINGYIFSFEYGTQGLILLLTGVDSFEILDV